VLPREGWRSDIDRVKRELQAGVVYGKGDQDGATTTDLPAFLTRKTTRAAAGN
jgi:hypothetical protein